MESAPQRQRLSPACEIILFVLVAAFAGVFARLHREHNTVHPPAKLELLSNYRAEVPYQYRVLVPTIVLAVDASGLGPALGLSIEDTARWIEIGCVIGAFYALRALLARFLPGRWPPSLWALLGLYALPFLYIVPRDWPYWYPWDLPAVLFTTLGVLWIHEQRWTWYYWIFPFATLNRETTVFLILVFALTQFRKLGWWSYVQHLAVQATIWLCIKYLLMQSFRRGPNATHASEVGEFYGAAFEDNWKALHHPATWKTLGMVFGLLWVPLLFFARNIREPFVRRALIVVPVFFAVTLKLAVINELRIYGEMLPLVVLGLACGIYGWRAPRVTEPSARRPGLP